MVVYAIWNRLNGKVYVGKTTKTVAVRWKEHLRDYRKHSERSHLYAAMCKYGPKSFDTALLSFARTAHELNFLEQEYIKRFRARDNRFGYNNSPGGDGGPLFLGRRHTEEARKKMRLARRGRRPFLNFNQTDEAKKRISASIKNNQKAKPRARRANGTFA